MTRDNTFSYLELANKENRGAILKTITKAVLLGGVIFYGGEQVFRRGKKLIRR